MERVESNRFVNDLSRAEAFEELRGLRDDDGLDPTAELDGHAIADYPSALDDETLRELRMLARMRRCSGANSTSKGRACPTG
jgi:N-formylglutamate amidohydrolase